MTSSTDTLLLIRRADCVVTMNDAGDELHTASVVMRGPEIVAVGPSNTVDAQWLPHATEVIDAQGHVVIPGLVNTHHHM